MLLLLLLPRLLLSIAGESELPPVAPAGCDCWPEDGVDDDGPLDPLPDWPLEPLPARPRRLLSPSLMVSMLLLLLKWMVLDGVDGGP